MASFKWWYKTDFLSEQESDYFREYLKANKNNNIHDHVKQGRRKKCDVYMSRILDIRSSANMDVLFKRLEYLVTHANYRQFAVDIYPLNNYSNVFLQEYKATNSGHYSYHHDAEQDDIAGDIKLSCIINVSDKKYSGGEFMLFDGQEIEIPELNHKGSLLIFPGNICHSVKPVKKGTRSSAIIWFMGPRWR